MLSILMLSKDGGKWLAWPAHGLKRFTLFSKYVLGVFWAFKIVFKCIKPVRWLQGSSFYINVKKHYRLHFNLLLF